MEYIDQWKGTSSKGSIIPWNKGRLVGPKPPLKLKEIWGIRVRLQLATQTRDLALFNLAIDSKLRGCDLVRLKVQDVAHGGRVLSRAAIVQQKTGRPVQFELTEQTRTSIEAWISAVALRPNDYLFPSRRRVLHIYPRGNTPESLNRGLRASALILSSTARTRCVARKRR
ncbi:integrase [Salinisphaera sp. T31B1]